MNISFHTIQISSLELRHRRYMAACEIIDSLPFHDRIALTKVQRIAQSLLRDIRIELERGFALDEQDFSERDLLFLQIAFSSLLKMVGSLRFDITLRRPFLLPAISGFPHLLITERSKAASCGKS